MFRHIPILVALACLGALVIAVPASAQTQVVETRLEVDPNDFPANQARNATGISGFIDEIRFCFDQGGFNPQSGAITLAITNTPPPEWATVSNLPPPDVTFTPPVGPGSAAACSIASGAIEFKVAILAAAPYDTVASIEFTITPSGTGIGTYMLPDPETVTLNIDTSPPPAGVPIPTDGPGAPVRGGDDTTESPATTPLALMLAVFALALLRRRVD